MKQLQKLYKWTFRVGYFFRLSGIIGAIVGALIGKIPIILFSILLLYAGIKSKQAYEKIKVLMLEKTMDHVDHLAKEIASFFKTLYIVLFLILLYGLVLFLFSYGIIPYSISYL